MPIIICNTAILSSLHLSLQSDFAGMESTISPLIDTGKINAVLLHVLFCCSISALLLLDLIPLASVTCQIPLDTKTMIIHVSLHHSYRWFLATTDLDSLSMLHHNNDCKRNDTHKLDI